MPYPSLALTHALYLMVQRCVFDASREQTKLFAGCALKQFRAMGWPRNPPIRPLGARIKGDTTVPTTVHYQEYDVLLSLYIR